MSNFNKSVIECMAELTSNSLFWVEPVGIVVYMHLPWAGVMGASLSWHGEKVSFLEGLEADHHGHLWAERECRL